MTSRDVTPLPPEELYRMPSNLAIRASAGTGKTYTLTKTIMHQLAGVGYETDDEGKLIPVPPNQILAITFTEKAASEMRERIRTEIRERIMDPTGDETLVATARNIWGAECEAAEHLPDSAHWRRMLGAFDRMTVSTFHSFAQGVLMQHPIEAGLSLDVTLLDETDSEALLDEVATEVIRRALERGDGLAERVAELAERFGLRPRQWVRHMQSELVRVLRHYRQEGTPTANTPRYTGDLGREYTDAVKSLLGSLQRFADLREDVDLIALKDRNNNDGKNATRLLAAARRTGLALAGFPTIPVSLADHRALVLPLLRRTWGYVDAGAFSLVSTSNSDLPLAVARICGVMMRTLGDAMRSLLMEAEEELELVKTARRVLTFTDLMLKVRTLLGTHPAIRRSLQKRYGRIFVDEFQDTNPVQLEIVERLVRKLTTEEEEEADRVTALRAAQLLEEPPPIGDEYVPFGLSEQDTFSDAFPPSPVDEAAVDVAPFIGDSESEPAAQGIENADSIEAADTVAETEAEAEATADDVPAVAEAADPAKQLSLFAFAESNAVDRMFEMSVVKPIERDPLTGVFETPSATDSPVGQYRERCLFVVGDAKQSIYGWRGARVDLFDELFERLIADGGSLGVLNTSYRSAKKLVDIGNDIFAHALDDFDGERDALIANRQIDHANASVSAWAVYTQRYDAPPDSPRPEHVIARVAGHWLYGSKRRMVEFRLSAKQQAELVSWSKNETPAPSFVRADQMRMAEQVREHGAPSRWPRPATPRDLTILVRSGRQADRVSWELDKAGIPNVSLTGSSFWTSLEVSDCVHALLALLDPTLDFAAIAMLRSPFWGLSDDALALLSELNAPPTLLRALQFFQTDAATLGTADARAVKHLVQTVEVVGANSDRLDAGELLGLLFESTHYLATIAGLPNGKRSVANLRQLQDLATRAAERGHTARQWAWSAYNAIQMNTKLEEAKIVTEADDVARVMTVHRAKGLEFPLCLVWAVDDPRYGRSDWVVTDEERGVLVRPREEMSLPTRYSVLRPTVLELQRFDDAADTKEALESMRLFYVAHTRASDHIGYVGRIYHGKEEVVHGWMAELTRANERGVLPMTHIQDMDDLPPAVTVPAHASDTEELPTKEQLERIMNADRVVSADARAVIGISALADFAAGPSQFYLRNIAGADIYEEPSTADGLFDALGYEEAVFDDSLSGREFGTLVHRAIEAIDWDGDDDEAIVSAMHAVGWQPPDRAAAIQRHVEAVLESPIATEIRDAAQRFAELPFLLGVSGGACRGAIDLLILPEDGDPIVIDFKTSRRPKPTRVDRHIDQVRAYACAVRALTEPSAERVRCMVLYTGGDQLEVVEELADAASMDAWQASAGESLSAIVSANVRSDWFGGD